MDAQAIGGITRRRRQLFALAAAGLAVGGFLLLAPMELGRSTGHISYSVQVLAPPDTEFSLTVPMPVEQNGSTVSWMGSLTISRGFTGARYVETEHGPGLLFEGRGNSYASAAIYVAWPPDAESNVSRHPGGLPDLSMWADDANASGALGEVWVHAEGTTNLSLVRLSVSIDYSAHCRKDTHEMGSYGEGVEVGWQRSPVGNGVIVC